LILVISRLLTCRVALADREGAPLAPSGIERWNRTLKLKELYVVDDQGNRISVVLDIAVYQELLEELEELESIRAYDAAKASGDQTVPFVQAIAEIDSSPPRQRRGSGWWARNQAHQSTTP
jgi:hypothetical protein